MDDARNLLFKHATGAVEIGIGIRSIQTRRMLGLNDGNAAPWRSGAWIIVRRAVEPSVAPAVASFGETVSSLTKKNSA